MHLSAKNLYKEFGSKIAVQNISLDIYPGKILALLGPNGAGKSTTIKMLTGQLKPTSGQIIIDQKSYDHFPEKLRDNLGIMPQEVIIWDDLNIRENLEYSADLYKLDSQKKAARVENLISDLKLEPEIKTLAKNLSGGYKRRLNLAISIIHDPEIIFLDEPTPGIDAQSRILLTEYIQKLADTGKYSIVLTDHYLEEAEKLADYVVIIDHGQIVTEGTVAELKAKHGQGNLLQVHLNSKQEKNLEQILAIFQDNFTDPKLTKETISVLVQNPADSLGKAMQIIQSQNLEILNINIKEPTLEDIFLIITGKEVRE
ncbi:MAG: ABC transporter ATP-binding protein [bacterium]